jgi:hypothetical protein
MTNLILGENPWQAVLDYHACMQRVVRTWEKFIQDDFHSDYFLPEDVLPWMARVSHTFDILRDEHMFDTMRSLRVHPVASGFPERLHLRLLEAKRDALIDQNGPDVNALKSAFLDELFTTGRSNHWLLEKIAKASAASQLLQHKPLQLFAINRLQRVDSKNGTHAFVCCFERYCYRHIPSTYLIVFESSDETLSEEVLRDLASVLKEETSHFPLLQRFAHQIDRAFISIHPKWVGRVSLGPVFISHVTRDEHMLQETLNDMTPTGVYQAASRIIYEYVASTSEVSVGRLYDPQGRAHTRLQEFAVRELDAECVERGVTSVEKHLFAPHHVIQALSEDFRREIGHRIKMLEE